MAKALEEINNRCGAVIMAANTANTLAEGAVTVDQLRLLIGRVSDAADKLREALWSDN